MQSARAIPLTPVSPMKATDSPSRWLLLIHRIPPKPGYVRVKIWRRLQGVGAVAIKNSVYVLPRSDQAHEDLQWISQEIVKSGGEAVLCEASFVDGIAHDEIAQAFVEAREADYSALGDDANALLGSLPEAPPSDPRILRSLESRLGKLRLRLDAIVAIDFFGGARRAAVERILSRVEARLRPIQAQGTHAGELDASDYQRRVWVTRRGIHVDRIASAWLIRRFVDQEATLRFVDDKAYAHSPGDLRFDMFDGEFTHEGELCSFEVILRRFGFGNPALGAIGEIVHDIDLKESRFGRPETAGFERLIAGICAGHREDGERLARGSAVLDDIYESFRRSAP